jgi:hypothetical protein
MGNYDVIANTRGEATPKEDEVFSCNGRLPRRGDTSTSLSARSSQ